MEKHEVLIRVDGSPEIGLGHLTRCIALAQMVKSYFNVKFVCLEIPVSTIAEIEYLGFEVFLITSEDLFLPLLEKGKIVVLDHYGLDTAYQKSIKSSGAKLICIDDQHEKIFFADVIINHAPNIDPGAYFAQTYTQFALGLDYVLLRPEFLENKPRKLLPNIECVFVCFGGSDFKNITLRVLNILKHDARIKKIIVVAGSAYPYLDQLQSAIEGEPRATLFNAVQPQQMYDLIGEAQLAIVPSSGILQEVLAVGCNIISGIYVDNQKNLFEKYKAMDVFESAGNFSNREISEAINRSFKKMNVPDHNLIDGRSGLRLLKIFNQLTIEDEVVLRKAVDGDLHITFKWATDKIIRSYSFNQHQINFDEHSNWFHQNINKKNCYYFIADLYKKAIGSIRFDLVGTCATVSYLIDPRHHNKGYGQILLKKGIEELLKYNSGVQTIEGFVMPENIASVKAFRRMGYQETIEKGHFRFIKKLTE